MENEMTVRDRFRAHMNFEPVDRLPIVTRDLMIRHWTRTDLDLLAAWPSYPSAYAPFNMSCRRLMRVERDCYHSQRADDPNRISLVIDHGQTQVVGYIALLDIDWDTRRVGNMGVRIHPAWCDRGVGSVALAAIVEWGRGNGLRSFRLDVAAANPRAVHCYEKAGFARTGETWRADASLTDVDLSDPRHADLAGHIRLDGPVPLVRFWWMTAA